MVPYLSKFFKYHNTVYTIFLYYIIIYNYTRKIRCYFIIALVVIKILKKKEGVSVSVQEQYLLLLQILPKFWSRFQLIGLKSTQAA